MFLVRANQTRLDELFKRRILDWQFYILTPKLADENLNFNSLFNFFKLSSKISIWGSHNKETNFDSMVILFITKR